MPGCCTKGTNSDDELRARNAPRAPPPQRPKVDNGGAGSGAGGGALGANFPQDSTNAGKKKEDDDGDNDARKRELGKGGGNEKDAGNAAGNAGNTTAHNDDDDDDDDLPMIIEAKVEEVESDVDDDEAAERYDAGCKICLTLFALLVTLVFLILFFLVFLRNEADKAPIVVVAPAIVPPYVLQPSGACISNPCLNFGACFAAPDHPSKYICTCRTGFSGQDCSKDDPCGPNDPCKPRGKCIKDDEEESFTCLCPKGFKGKRCSEELVLDRLNASTTLRSR